MERAKNAVIVGLAVIIVIVLVGIVYLFAQNNSGNIHSSDNNEGNQQQNNENSNSNGKIDDTKDIVYESVVSKLVDTSGQEIVVSLPVINIDAEEIKKLNKEIIDKHSKSYYTEFEYYQYNDILSICIYLGVSAGEGSFAMYNIDIKNNKVIKDNNELFAKLNIDVEKYLIKQNEAIMNYFENYWKDRKDMFGTTEEYKEQYNIAKKYTQSEKNNSINNKIYVNKNNEICVSANIYQCAGAEPPIYERIVKVCNVTDDLTSGNVVKQSNQFYLDLVKTLPMQINMINKSFTDVNELTEDQKLAIVLAYNLRNNYEQWERKETGITLKQYNIYNEADVNTLENIKKSELELFGKEVIKSYNIKGALSVYSDNTDPSLEQICYSEKIKYGYNKLEPCYFMDFDHKSRMYTPISIFEKVEVSNNTCSVYVKQAYSAEGSYLSIDDYLEYGNRIMDYTTNRVIYSNHNYCLNSDFTTMSNEIRSDLDNLYNEYKNQMSTYKYTFKIENDKYYLQKVEITPISSNISKNFGEDLYFVKDNAISFIRWELYRDYGDWKTGYYLMDNKLYHYDMVTLKSTLLQDNVISIEYKDKKIQVLVKENSKTYDTSKDKLGILKLSL